MEKEKINQPNDFSAEETVADLMKLVSTKARELMTRPSHDLIERPSHEIANLPNREIMIDPDRVAEQKSRQFAKDYKKIRSFHDNDISAMQSVKEERDISNYAREIGENPDTYVGVLRPGVITDLVGNNESSVFEEEQINDLDRLEKKVIRETKNDSEKIVSNIPESINPGKLDETEFHIELFKKRPPYDQDVA